MRIASLLAAVALAASSSAAFAGTPILECGGCSYAYSEIYANSGQLGEVSGTYKYEVWQAEGGYGQPSTLVSAFGTSPKGFTFDTGASGSLLAGALHASASQAGGFAGAFVELKDAVMFQFDPALVASGVRSLTGTLTWTVEGVQHEVNGQSYAGPDGNTQVSLLTRSYIGAQMNISDFKWSDHPIMDGQTNSPPFEGADAYKVTYRRDFMILPDTYYNLDAVLSVSAGSGFAGHDPEGAYLSNTAPSSADYGNTSFFNFILPEGVKLLSGSGVLLDAPYQPGGIPTVPEPATWLMLIIGFGAIGAALRGRHAQNWQTASVNEF